MADATRTVNAALGRFYRWPPSEIAALPLEDVVYHLKVIKEHNKTVKRMVNGRAK